MQIAAEIRSVSKRYGGVQALYNIDLTIEAGTIHALLGGNGAGKSTLLKILQGIERPDAGEIAIFGEVVRESTPQVMRDKGVAMIFQEMSLIPTLDSVDNILLGREPRNAFGLISGNRMRKVACELLATLSSDIDAGVPVSRLNAGQRQIVEIAKALSQHARILILDEPTAALSSFEISRLFNLVRQLSAKGVTVIYVSHKMDEIEQLAEVVTILRDGRHVVTAPKRELGMDRTIELMIGRRMEGFSYLPRKVDYKLPPRLTVERLSGARKPKNVSFELWKGEILGVAGTLGSGRSELAQVIAGFDRRSGGEVSINGSKLPGASPKHAIAAGIALVPEDRRSQGLSLMHSAAANMTLPTIDRLGFGPFVREAAIRHAVKPMWDQLQVRGSGHDIMVGRLSGGNQQKIVLAKWLLSEPSILILDEPTAGIDIQSKVEIIDIIRREADAGMSVIFISSEIPELLAASDRILVIDRAGQTIQVTRSEIATWSEGVDDAAHRNFIAEQKLTALMQSTLAPSEPPETRNSR